MVTVDSVIFSETNNEVKILLIKRKNPPFEGKWAFPGGFVGIDEPIEAAANRELMEEAGIKVIKLEQLHTYGAPDRDPRGRCISIAFYGFANADEHPPQPGDDAAEAKWFSLNEIPPLAFDHERILRHATNKIHTSLNPIH